MKIRALACGLACTLCLYGQKRFNWQEACFLNPAAPYCPGHDFAIKPAGKNGAAPNTGSYAGTLPLTPSTIDAAGIDWRFADPSANSLAVLNGSKLAASPQARGLIEQVGAKQRLSQAEVQNVLRGLSGVEKVALSAREDRIVLMVTGRAPDSVLPAPEPGWKAVTLPGHAILIGHADAVDQAVQRISTASPLGDLARLAQQRQVDSEFWAAGSAKQAGEAAANAGVKQFSLTVSMSDRLTIDTVFELNAAPDTNAIQAWLNTLGDTKVEGNIVHAKTSLEADEARLSVDKIALSPFGQRIGLFIKSARNLPVRDTTATVHTKPVIYGLDDGAREVKDYVPSATQAVPAPVTTSAPATLRSGDHLDRPQSRTNYTWVIQSTSIGTSPGKYSSFYYEPATDRSVEKPLTLPAGAAIVGVFPADCTFSVRNESGKSFTFRNETEAKANALSAGTWSVFPLKCGGVAVFLK